MIGQNELLNQFKEMIADREVMFPKFIILVGPKGSGKKTMANEIYKMISESANINVNQYCTRLFREERKGRFLLA